METSTSEGVLLRNIPVLRAFNGSYEHKCISCFLFFMFNLSLLLALSVISNINATYRTMHISQKIYWSLAGVRSLFGVSSVVLSVITLLGDEELREDIVLGRTLSCQFFFTYIVGFFIFECSLLSFTELAFGVKSLGLLAHHFLALLGYFVGLFWDHGYCIGTLVVSLEMSTPFSCFCWVLLKLNLSKSMLWTANQWLLVHLFHTRQNVLCVVMYVVAKDWENVYQNMNMLLTVPFIGGVIIMLVGLNPYWTQKKTQQLFSREDWNFHPPTNNTSSKSTNQCNGSPNKPNGDNGTGTKASRSLPSSPKKKTKRGDSKKLN